MPPSDMNLDHLPDVVSARLLWREQVAALPRSLWHALRRLARREARYYLTIDGKVVARFTADADSTALMTWLADTHSHAFDFGFETWKEHQVAVFLAS